MAEEPGHKAMLYFLEVLMNSNGPLTISQLSGRFGSRSFTQEMRQACGGNEPGLKKFLLKYPSLFTVTGNMVSLFDESKSPPTPPTNHINGNSGGILSRSLPDVSLEMEAVSFFQEKLVRKEERWVQIRSLAGHLSQAKMELREVVGPQLEFRNWLLKHPHIFEVQGDLVGMRDGLAAVATSAFSRRSMEGLQNGLPETIHKPTVRIVPPKTPPATRRFPPKTPPAMRRSKSFSEKRTSSDSNPLSPIMQPKTSKGSPVAMTANEYKAVMFLKDIVETAGSLKVNDITSFFGQATEGVRNTIGWTHMELTNFITKNDNMFTISSDDCVVLNKHAKLNVVITGSRPHGAPSRTLEGRHGKVFHVAKLWGIIDLGRHEHVFFDKSIMKIEIDDMQKYFVVGETLYFNAVLAIKSSRAKWRATQVWRESEQEQPALSDVYDNGPLSPAASSIEEEMNNILTSDRYGDAAPSMAGIIPVWNYNKDDDNPRQMTADGESLAMLTESQYMNNSTVNHANDGEKTAPTASVVNGHASKPGKTMCDMACQTISTGEIIATQLFHD